ncbi:MAG: hypothetical protein PHV78_01075 [Patescibacteria group bacterium]|nr:hypothetical protein [Patescibacteria group bacterium]MDD5121245.1 hypothetical protein [Patescibacteria group bacterium]MDD5222094.1 hypothetical protein [Patescibacteria group bacterium]MDD5395836.1 hypothetical protein [Patescibacteria group bacterium]
MNISDFFGLIAGIVAVIAYGLYFRQAVKGSSTPNPSTWAIWVLIGIINSFTYFSLVANDWRQGLVVLTAATFSLITFIYSLFRGRFSRISKIEIITFILAVLIGIFWRFTANDRMANLFLQAIYVISYIPTISGLARGRAKEGYVAWVVACVAYLLSAITVATNPRADWIALVFPLVNGLLGNGTIAVLTIYKQRVQNNTL